MLKIDLERGEITWPMPLVRKDSLAVCGLAGIRVRMHMWLLCRCSGHAWGGCPLRKMCVFRVSCCSAVGACKIPLLGNAHGVRVKLLPVGVSIHNG